MKKDKKSTSKSPKKQTKSNTQNNKSQSNSKPKSQNLFETLNPSLKKILIALGYESLTTLQQKILKELSTKHQPNLICKCPKNSGKILSILLPIISKIIENDKENVIERFIIITGIKERADEFYSLSKELLQDINGKFVIKCIGGANRKKEAIKLLDNNIKIIISTPQRIIEHIQNDKNKKTVLHKDVSTIFFEKIENLKKNGYFKEIKEIFEFFGFNIIKVSKNKEQKLIDENINFILFYNNEDFSDDINEIIEETGRKFDNITIKNNENNNLNVKNNSENNNKVIIKQRGYITLSPDKKFLFLLTFLRKNSTKKITVFFSTNKEVLFYKYLLNLYHINITILDSTQNLKTNKKILSDFSKEKNGIFFTTDLSKMHLNTPISDWIVFYDAPIDIEIFEKNLELNLSVDNINNIKAFMILMPNEEKLLKENKNFEISKFNLNLGQIDKDQKKVEKMVNSKEHEVIVLAFESYRAFLFNYVSRDNKEIFDLNEVDVSLLCKSFGFEYPPYVNLSTALKTENIWEEKNNRKKKYLSEEEIRKIYGDEEDKNDEDDEE